MKPKNPSFINKYVLKIEDDSNNASKCPVTGATGKHSVGASGPKTVTGGRIS